MKKAKKAVFLVKTLLKIRKKFDNEDNFNVFEAREKDKKIQRHLSENFSFHRLCRHCVLVYDKLARRNYFQEIVDCREDIKPNSLQEKHRNNYGWIPQYVGLLVEHSSGFSNFDEDSWTVFIHSIREHAFKRWERGANMEPHYPVFIWIRETEEIRFSPSIFDHQDLFFVRINMKTLCKPVTLRWTDMHSNKNGGLPGIKTLEVWALVNKVKVSVGEIYEEKNLMEDLIETLEWEVFLNLPASYEERYKRLEELFQNVDKIIDLSAYIDFDNCDLEDNMAAMKEAIIETATVITGTAAESTATVGIETAALSLGQAAAGVAISVLVDVALTARSITKAKVQRDKGLITHNQFKSAVRRHLCDSGFQFIGGTTGTIVGQVLIPVPVVGAIVGGFFGSLIGVGVSKGIIKTSELISEARLKNQLKAIKDT